MYQRSLAVLLLLAFAAPIFGQTAATQPDSKPETDLRKEAVAFLRETMADVQNMRTLENRISFSAELAGLMWYHDENEARTIRPPRRRDHDQERAGFVHDEAR